MLLVLLLGSWPVGTAWAGFPGERFGENVVVGAHLVVPLEATEGRRGVGVGVDVGYQVQWYTQRSGRFDGTFVVWAEEHPAWSYGPVTHLWWQGGHWHHSLGARFGVAWPLRVGLDGDWWPGPAVAAEAGLGLSTSGVSGLDVQGVVDGPWVQGRVGGVLNGQGLVAPRLQLGAFTPLGAPSNPPPFDSDQWKAPDGA